MKITYYSLLFLFAFVADNIALNTPKLPADTNLLTNLWANYYESKLSAAPKKEQTNQEELKEKARGYLAAQPVKFLENKGQMMDVNSKPVPFVLFKAEAPGMNVYITEKGLTYVFVKAEEEEHEREREKEKEREKGMLAGPEEENVKMEMAWVHVNLEGANIQRSNIIKEGQSSEHFNYFYGHCPEGIYDVQQYDKITIKDVYPGIDWVFYNSQKTGMKYDFVVHPGADPSQIKLLYEGDKPLKMEEDGSISIKTKLGTLTEAKPYTYEEGNNNEIQSNYKLTTINKNKTLLEFNLANHNTNNTLVIDPQLNWGTFFGGNDIEEVKVTEVDGTTGDVYIGGYIQSIGTSFPIQNLIGAYNANILNGTADAYISKFSSTGNLLWSTYYGGAAFETLQSLSLDGSGNVFITGSVSGAGFPTFNPSSGAYFQGTYGGGLLDIFIVKFSNIGVRLWATYYGGSSTDSPRHIHCDNMGNLFLVGRTDSPNFPTWFMAGAYNDNTLNGAVDCYIVKFSNIGALQWSTFFGGSNSEFVFSLATDGGNNLYITGSTGSLPTSFPIVNLGGAYNQAALAGGSTDAYLAKFSNTGNLVWCTYFGGISSETGFSVASDVSNNVYLVGLTDSPNFPIQNLPGAYNQSVYAGGSGDIFIAKFSITGNLDWSTFYGGNGQESFLSSDNLELDACGNIFLTFYTNSVNTPTQPWQASCGGFNDNTLSGTIDLFLTHFSSTGALIWATYIGGDGGDGIASVDSYNTNIYIAGCSNNPTSNATYPLANPGGGAYYDPTFSGGQQDVFVMKFTPIPPTYAQSQTNPSACNCNGVATISVTCGEAPYTYQWSNAVTVSNSTLTSHSITGLCPGVYQVTVTSNCNYSYTTNFNISCPLPIELLEFTAMKQSNVVECNWKTATEINNDYFTVEKSTDAINFEIVGKLKGAGNSNTIKNYKMSDEKPYNGVSYYRLKQTDFNGAFKYSKLVAVNFQLSSSTVSVFPNPSSGNFTIINTEYTDMIILDELGRIIYSVFLEPGKRIDINLNSFNNGLYIAIFRNTINDEKKYMNLIKTEID